MRSNSTSAMTARVAPYSSSSTSYRSTKLLPRWLLSSSWRSRNAPSSAQNLLGAPLVAVRTVRYSERFRTVPSPVRPARPYTGRPPAWAWEY
eukprot:2245585-Heterocapsa_arctica.AAC.1